jgi:hypothetical protein
MNWRTFLINRKVHKDAKTRRILFNDEYYGMNLSDFFGRIKKRDGWQDNFKQNFRIV